MPDNPHEYTLRSTWAEDAAFVRVVQFIFDHGTVEPWGRCDYKILVVGGFKYWAMDARYPGRGWDWADRATVINRKRVGVTP